LELWIDVDGQFMVANSIIHTRKRKKKFFRDQSPGDPVLTAWLTGTALEAFLTLNMIWSTQYPAGGIRLYDIGPGGTRTKM